MNQDRRYIVALANILIAKHGFKALEVAARRTRLWTEAHDEVTADLWREVGDAVAVEMARHELTLTDILYGAVTRQTMDADGVTREHVEELMSSVLKTRKREQ